MPFLRSPLYGVKVLAVFSAHKNAPFFAGANKKQGQEGCFSGFCVWFFYGWAGWWKYRPARV